MYQEVEKFFLAFFGENFETSVLQAFFVCFTLMLVYGIIVRPFINLINGKQKRSFFDTITITLIILIGVKILFPAALTFEQTVNVTVENVSGNINQEDEKLDLPEYSSYEEVCEAYGYSIDDVATDENGLYCGSSMIFVNSPTLEICDFEICLAPFMSNDAIFYLDGELWYEYDLGVDGDVWYEVTSDVRYICFGIGA